MIFIGYKIIYRGRKKTHKRILFQDEDKYYGFSDDELEGIDMKKLIIGHNYDLIYHFFDRNKIIDVEEVLP